LKVLRTIETFLPYVCGPTNQAFQISDRLEALRISSPVLTTYCDVDPGLPDRETIGRVAVTRLPIQFQCMRYCLSLGMILIRGGMMFYRRNFVLNKVTNMERNILKT